MTVTDSLIRSWIALQGQMMTGLQRAYVELQGNDVFHSGLTVAYPENAEPAIELTLAAQLARHSKAPVTGTCISSDDGAALLRIAYPLQLLQNTVGAIVVEVNATLDKQAALLQMLEWGETWLNLTLAQGVEEPDSAGYKRLIDAGMSQRDHRDTVTVVLALLRVRTGCTRVALGRSTGTRMKLEAVSEVSELDPRSARAKALESAMTEALQSGTTVSCTNTVFDPEALPQHRRLVDKGSLAGVCSVPILFGNRDSMAFCFEFSDRFAQEDSVRTVCEEGATIVAPLLELHREVNRPWLSRLVSLCQDGIDHLKDAHGRRGRVVMLATILLLALISLSAGEYRVSASATLEAAVQRAVVAPFDGYVLDAEVRAGHEVTEADLLARLDDRELVGERRRLRAEQGEFSEQHRQAVATLDHGKAKVLEAQLEQASARLALVQDKLVRTELRAPISGLVISGDWSRSLGVPVQRGDLLFQIAPLDEYQVVMRVSDRDIAGLEVGQSGELTLSALPRQSIRFTVLGISMMAPEEVGEPTFRVEATLDDTLQGMRPGMQGIAKVDVGERRRWWIWTHSLTDWLRLRLWKIWP